MTPEGKVKDIIKTYLDSLGPLCWHFMPMMMGYGRKGIPDVIGCYKGHFFAIEVKAEGKAKAITPWQAREAAAIGQAHGLAWLIDGEETLTQFKAWVDAV